MWSSNDTKAGERARVSKLSAWVQFALGLVRFACYVTAPLMITRNSYHSRVFIRSLNAVLDKLLRCEREFTATVVAEVMQRDVQDQWNGNFQIFWGRRRTEEQKIFLQKTLHEISFWSIYFFLLPWSLSGWSWVHNVRFLDAFVSMGFHHFTKLFWSVGLLVVEAT